MGLLFDMEAGMAVIFFTPDNSLDLTYLKQ
jgi:hypothetical protein